MLFHEQWNTSPWENQFWSVGIAVKRTMYQCKVDVDMLNTERAVG